MPLRTIRRPHQRLTLVTFLTALLLVLVAPQAHAALFYGTSRADTFRPGAGNDWAWGNGGNDTITDRGGRDTLNGGAGADTITGDRYDTIYGGNDNDTIVLTSVAGLGFRVDCGAGADTVTVQDPGNETDAAIRGRLTGCETVTITRAATPTPPADTTPPPVAEPPAPAPTPPPTPSTPPTPPAPTPPPTPTQPSTAPGFVLGMHTGARDIDYRATQSLRPGLVRVGGLDASMSRAQVAAIAAQYTSLGARIIALVDFNDAAPSDADARNVGTWATIPGLDAIEYGNEPWLQNESWDYVQYARSFKLADDAVRAANPNMVVVAVGDSANRSHRPGLQVMKAMKAIGARPRAVQFHPYGPNYMNRLGDVRRDLAEVGWSDTAIWATETGVSTDDGRTVYQGSSPNNYGWNTAMTYAEAAKTVTKIVTDLKANGVARVILYMGTDYAAHGGSSEREKYFGLTTSTGADKGAYTPAVRTLMRANR